MSLLQLLQQPGNRNLLNVLTRLPQVGVGSKVTRAAWEPYGDSYWEVTAVKPRSADGKFGKVWGVLTWRGQREARPRQINGRAKKLWRWVPPPQEAERLRHLAQELQQLQKWQQLAAQGATGGAADSSDSAASS